MEPPCYICNIVAQLINASAIMKLWKIILLPVLVLAMTVVGCKEEEDIASVEIEFEEPVAGEIVADASDVHIHVHFTGKNTDVHEVEVELHPDDDVSDKIIEWDEHSHEAEVIFEQEVDLSSYPSGTEFHLEAKACIDHDCNEVVTGDIEFSIP
jgi:hypothetical protein